MHNRRFSALRSLPLALLLALPLAACGEDGGGGGGGDACDSSTLTYANFAEGFFTDYCTRCHAPGAAVHQDPDFDTIEKVMAQSARINARAGAGLTMPPSDPRPSTQERADLSEWIECGTK